VQAADPFPATDVDPPGAFTDAASVANTGTVTSPGSNCPVDGSGGPEGSSTTHTPLLTDLTIVKTASAAPVVPGQQFSSRLTVTNPAAVDDVGAVARDRLPFGFFFVSASDPRCTAVGRNLTCSLGTLAPGAAAAFQVDVVVRVANPFPFTTTGA